MHISTADLCDELQDRVKVLKPIFNSYGGVKRAKGVVSTIELNEDNSGLIEMLKEDGNNRVAVVKVTGEICAVVGDKLMTIAKNNNWSAILVDGYIRDIDETRKIDVGLWAIGTYPQKSQLKSSYKRGVKLQIAGVQIEENDMIYLDSDGIIISQ